MMGATMTASIFNTRTARTLSTKTIDILNEEYDCQKWTSFDSKLDRDRELADRVRDLRAELDYYESNFDSWVASWQAAENAEGVLGAGSHIVDYLMAKMDDLRAEIAIAEEELVY